ncbi:MAG: type I glyceraldehyde-3-phosphate dehydrogenase [Candidatus Krumholzibacteriota bacterium]|nr:type I glyceraldehyde-3-phosphate dehydrogenase [Candidatus Krumholzibacteriota bacterium]
MAINVAINGFGRIGRLVFRGALAARGINVVAINDLTDADTLGHLLKYDSVHGRFPGSVTVLKSGYIKATSGGQTAKVKVLAERDPAMLPWKELEVDVVIESTGLFRKRKDAGKHIAAGARKVIISAPSGDADIMIVMGVNSNLYRKGKHHIISTASCTTNCLAPVAKILNDAFGIANGLMTTIHAYTNDQMILDAPHKDLRRARAAAVSMIPTTTGAAKATGVVLPKLAGKLDGMAVRVPTADGSLVDLTVTLRKKTTIGEINAAMRTAAAGPLKGILEYTEDPIVSCDIIGNHHSSIFDARATMMITPTVFKVLSWYDNECGYAMRMVDMMKLLMK